MQGGTPALPAAGAFRLFIQTLVYFAGQLQRRIGFWINDTSALKSSP